MSRLSASQSRGLAHQQAAQGSPVFTFASTEIPCAVSSLKRGTELMVGGFTAMIHTTLIVRRGDITGSVPTAGQSVTYAGTSYRVLAVTRTAGAATYEFDLGNVNK